MVFGPAWLEEIMRLCMWMRVTMPFKPLDDSKVAVLAWLFIQSLDSSRWNIVTVLLISLDRLWDDA